jgi:hypothetical protein
VWPAAIVALLAGFAQHVSATAAPGASPPASTFADIPVTPKPKPPATVIRAGPSKMTLADRAAAERAGPPGTGKSNLACMVFEGRTGLDARSTLYNRCGTGVRLNYCLQYKNGADNCLPGLALDDSMATLWDLLAGQSLVMPATDILKRWSVFACETPLTPWLVLFRDGTLNGDCVETGLEPPPGMHPPHPIIRSNDPTTWPAGTINLTCLTVAPVLAYYQMQLINHCDRKINVVICATTYIQNGSWPCVGDVPEPIPSQTWPGMATVEMLPRPSAITRWSAFACFDPEVPRHPHYNGTRLVADCVGPPETDTAVALPHRGGNKATARLSDEMSDEDLAAREQERSAASQAINNERSRISRDANNVLGVLTDVAVTTAQTYAAVEAQQQEQQLLQQQQAAAANAILQQQASPTQGYKSPQNSSSSASSGSGRHEVLVDHAGSCAHVVDQVRDSDVEGMIWFAFQNSCSFPINIWHNQIAEGRFTDMSTAPAGGKSSRGWEVPPKYGRTGIVFIACPQFMNGQTVYKRDGANGGFYCYYWSS